MEMPAAVGHLERLRLEVLEHLEERLDWVLLAQDSSRASRRLWVEEVVKDPSI